ncbi:hypothetical protein FQN50_006538 [Emmonsiellopsis sp. PD_5]|nr:hypothetical protein FQN50_006538 [Emmonsiellopsis sp. PD_5]
MDPTTPPSPSPSPSPSPLPLLPPELLTTILTHLDPLTLLHAQRVSHHWHQTITTSPTLQQTLYLHPLPNPTNAVLNPTLNPLLLPLFPTLFTLTNRPPYPHFLNPHGLTEMSWAQDARKKSAVLRPTASWRRMFPVQPPARIDVIKRRGYCCLYRMVRRDARIRDEFEYLQGGDGGGGGARMGLIYDLLVDGLERWADGRFFVRWHMFVARDGEGWEGERRRLLRNKGYDEVGGKGGRGGGKLLENRITLYCRFSEKCWNRDVKEYGLGVVERFGRGKLRRLREDEREDGYYYADTSDSEDEPDDDEEWEEEEEEEGEQGDGGEEDDRHDSDFDFEDSDDSVVSE